MNFLLLFSLIPLIHGIVVKEGACPDIDAVQNFDLGKFTGRWYITHSIPLDHEIHLKCTTETFTVKDDGKILGVFNYIDINTKESGNWSYALKPAKDDKTGDFLIGSLSDEKSFEHPLKVIATDYDNYVVFWCCKVKDDKSYRVAIIESREPNLSDDLLKKAYDVLDKNDLDRSQMQKIVQDDCS